MPELAYVSVKPKAEHTSSVIWMHGLGADGHDFESILPELKLPHSHGIHFIFPHAPMRSVTINGGHLMPAWYDILSMDLGREIDVEQLDVSANQIEELIEMEQAKGIPCENIILAGFSQGGAVAIHTGIRYPEKLGGILALSTYLGDASFFEEEDTIAPNLKTPIWWGHGQKDPVVPLELGARSVEILQDRGYSVSWNEYTVEHGLVLEELRDLAEWLHKMLLK
jgi:phospholipase/carboxylesterase